jgi:hypothetical protein
LHTLFFVNLWSAQNAHSKHFGVHKESTPKYLEWTTIHSKFGHFLEWSDVHSKIVGVGMCPLQKHWGGHLPTPKSWSACSITLECIKTDPTLIPTTVTKIQNPQNPIDCSRNTFIRPNDPREQLTESLLHAWINSYGQY